MPPTPVWMTLTRTSGCWIFASSETIASTEPCTSPLMTMFRSWTPPACICAKSLSSETPPLRCFASASRRSRSPRCCASSRARARSRPRGRARRRAAGGRSRGSRRARRDGPPGCARRGSRRGRAPGPTRRRRRSRRRPCSVPRWTSIVATGPRPTSRRDSMIGPEASADGFARRSSSASATSRMRSSRSSRFSPCFADTRAICTSPPHSSGCRPSVASSASTRSGLASGRSILLTATTIGTSAARAWEIDSLRLRHDAVVGGDDEHGDVGHLRAAGAHGRERLVARRVEERDPAAVVGLPGRRRCAG